MKIVCGVPTTETVECVQVDPENSTAHAERHAKDMARFLYNTATWVFVETMILEYLKLTNKEAYEYMKESFGHAD